MKKQLAGLILVSFVMTAWADDTVEAVAADGIVFEKTPELIMQDETLTISKLGTAFFDQNDSIDVDFHFKNTSDHDVTRKIAFVLPPVHCELDTNSAWIGLEGDDKYAKGLKDFTVTVDGKPQVYSKRIEAKLNGRNITDMLTKLNVPLNPCLIKTMSDGKLDPKYYATLQKNNLLTKDNIPAWSENIYFEWTQTFPAGKVVNIQHHYTPVIGATVASPMTVSDLNKWYGNMHGKGNLIWNRSPSTLAITNPSIINKNNAAYKDNETRFCIMPTWVLYNLQTGANWNGGIGQFKLIISDVSGAPFAVNDFYKPRDAARKSIDSKSMTFTIDHFIPTKELKVLFLSLPQNAEDLKSCGM